jgi:predicted ATPase
MERLYNRSNQTLRSPLHPASFKHGETDLGVETRNAMIRKVCIRNYRRFRKFDIELQPGINVLVGCNGSGKSTLIEAIDLALTGRVHGRFLAQGVSPYLINLEATRDYFQQLRESGASNPQPPKMIIDVFLDDEDAEILRGTNNLDNEDACGVRIQAQLSGEFHTEYQNFLKSPGSTVLAPTEYYNVEWLGFSGNPVNARSVPTSTTVIDPTMIRLQAGVDYHLQQILTRCLDPKERVELSRQYRGVREEFSERESVKAINKRLSDEDGTLTDRKLSLATDISQRYAWESGLAAHLDDLPLHLAGQGDQNALKTLLAIGQRADGAEIVLIEEPENHLSFSYLRKLIKSIEDRCASKQLIVATHSTFVLNKLGLQSLLLLSENGATRIVDLPPDTVDYFKKLSGFDTLRLVLSKGAILVEGPSDELVVQRGYLDAKGRLPIDDGIDVISVGLSHKRFLELAIRLKRRVWVVTDNDGKTVQEKEVQFAEYLLHDCVSLHTGKDPKFNTLEPQIVEVNSVATLNEVLGTSCGSKEELCKVMHDDKTAAALAIFTSEKSIKMPEYIQDVFKG